MMTLADTLDSLLPPEQDRRFGELLLRRCADGHFHACHKMDKGMESELTRIESPELLREKVKFDTMGTYRPLKTAPTLPCGWRIESTDAESFLELLDCIYPGLFATWVAYEKGEQEPVPLRETLARQSGINESAADITDAMANQIMRDICAQGCLRQIAWPIDDSCAVSRLRAHPKSIPAICTEACTFAVAEAKRLVEKSSSTSD